MEHAGVMGIAVVAPVVGQVALGIGHVIPHAYHLTAQWVIADGVVELTC
jgi:hypothetical protein